MATRGGRSHACCPSHQGSGQHEGPHLKCQPYKRRRWRSNILLPLFPSQFPTEPHLLKQVIIKPILLDIHSVYTGFKKKVSKKVTLNFQLFATGFHQLKVQKLGEQSLRVSPGPEAGAESQLCSPGSARREQPRLPASETQGMQSLASKVLLLV